MNFAKDTRGEGMTGNAVMWIPRIILITLIMVVMLGISGSSYSNYIDVRDAEAEIMVGKVIGCLTNSGIVDLDLISEEQSKSLLSYCGFDEAETSRFFVSVELFDGEDNLIQELVHGDSSLAFVRDLFDETKFAEDLQKYKPGFYGPKDKPFSVLIKSKGNEINGNLKIKVVVDNEF
jgi:hypothetical protein